MTTLNALSRMYVWRRLFEFLLFCRFACWRGQAIFLSLGALRPGFVGHDMPFFSVLLKNVVLESARLAWMASWSTLLRPATTATMLVQALAQRTTRRRGRGNNALTTASASFGFDTMEKRTKAPCKRGCAFCRLGSQRPAISGASRACV